jgi:hypothetical protein
VHFIIIFPICQKAEKSFYFPSFDFLSIVNHIIGRRVEKITTFRHQIGNRFITLEALDKMTWKFILLIVALTVSVAFGDYQSRWVPQRINHFDPSDHRQWNMVRMSLTKFGRSNCLRFSHSDTIRTMFTTNLVAQFSSTLVRAMKCTAATWTRVWCTIWRRKFRATSLRPSPDFTARADRLSEKFHECCHMIRGLSGFSFGILGTYLRTICST